jgi:hypothetical protein
VLTAEHCFSKFVISNMADVQVVVGKAGREKMAFDVDWKQKHPGFQTNGPHSHDLAIIKLKSKGDGSTVQVSENVSPICLPGPKETFNDGMSCIITGWGQILRNTNLIHNYKLE